MQILLLQCLTPPPSHDIKWLVPMGIPPPPTPYPRDQMVGPYENTFLPGFSKQQRDAVACLHIHTWFYTQAKKTAALLHPESTERRSRGRIMEKTRNSLKDREKGEKGSPVVLKTEEKRQQEHVPEKVLVCRYRNILQQRQQDLLFLRKIYRYM